jgi:radical SAM protein with 4Fe4S-binding SPASM domain
MAHHLQDPPFAGLCHDDACGPVTRNGALQFSGEAACVASVVEPHIINLNPLGAKLLRERDIPVTIKTPIMRQNAADYHELIALAEELGAYYILDPQMVPRNDGDHAPLQYRVDNGKLAELYNDPALYDQPCTLNADEFDAIMNAVPCGTGRRICVVDPYGEVYGCLQMLRSNGNVRERSLADIWHNGANFQEIRSKRRKDLVRCETCPGPPYCRPCMGLSLMEHGEIVGNSKIACRQPPQGVQTMPPSPPETAIRTTLSRPYLCWAAVSALCSAQMPRR